MPWLALCSEVLRQDKTRKVMLERNKKEEKQEEGEKRENARSWLAVRCLLVVLLPPVWSVELEAQKGGGRVVVVLPNPTPAIV